MVGENNLLVSITAGPSLITIKVERMSRTDRELLPKRYDIMDLLDWISPVKITLAEPLSGKTPTQLSNTTTHMGRAWSSNFHTPKIQRLCHTLLMTIYLKQKKALSIPRTSEDMWTMNEWFKHESYCHGRAQLIVVEFSNDCHTGLIVPTELPSSRINFADSSPKERGYSKVIVTCTSVIFGVLNMGFCFPL